MDSYPVSDELKAWLDRHGMRSRTAGTVALHGKGAGTKVEEAFAPATANSGRGDRAPIWNSGEKDGTGEGPAKFHNGGNSAKAGRSHCTFLRIVVDNGRDVGRRNPTRKAPLGLPTSLLLIEGGKH